MANSLEQMEAKAVGTAKAVKAGFNGLRGVFLHLAEEHGEVGALMKHVSKSADPKVRAELYPKIRSELLSHERGELSEVYPALSQHLATRDIAAAHNIEAQQLELAIKGVDSHDFASPQWGPAFEQLFQLVQQHVAEEENDFFPKAQAVLGEGEAKAMLDRYEAAKKASQQPTRS
ncbi:MAG TPA: hemerythrin domain-containing protein [Polyangiaceae bacterium]|jgi:hemerythrin superfamily protein|nr:hemerythrin domain-containing protein [Polyangiaceae bacterium]